MKNRNSAEKYQDVTVIIDGLVDMNAHQVRARYPKNKQYEASDEYGNKIVYVYSDHGNLFRPIEILDQNNILLAKSTDSINWSTINSGFAGVDYSLDQSADDLIKARNATKIRKSVRGSLSGDSDMEQAA